MIEQGVPPTLPTVELSGVGVVSLATLGELRDARRAEQAEVDRLAWQLEDLDWHLEDRLADAGALLVPRRAWWEVPPRLAPQLAEAERLAARIAGLDERLAAAGPEDGHLAATIRRWTGGRARDRARASARLRQALVQVARGAAEAGARAPGVDPLLEQAAWLEEQADGLRGTLAGALARLGALHQEVGRREEAERQLGFDSLHLAAHFRLHGLPAIEVPFPLQAGEVAHLATGAALARMPPGRRPSGGPGTRVPAVAHTGVHQWVGGLLDRAAPGQGAQPGDRGTLVVTNQRLAYVGTAEPVDVPLAAVVDVDVYADAVAVFRLGREVPDLILTGEPRQVAFYLNWALASGFGA